MNHEVEIRWLIRDDLPAVMRIENQSPGMPSSESDIIDELRKRNCVGMVAEHEGRIVGYMIYDLNQNALYVAKFAVAASWRRRGVGSTMARKLINKLSVERRERICLEVGETNLTAQLFWQSQGFRAESIFRGSHDGSTEDVYLMEYRLGVSAGNRISEYGRAFWAD